MSNDFSQWLEEEVGLPQAAESIERIDIYTNTLEGVRQHIASIVVSQPDHSQTHGPFGALGGRVRLSDSAPADASGFCETYRGERKRACEGELPDDH
jgi:hypothetical protein